MKVEITKAPNLLTNGFVKTIGDDGSLTVDSTSTLSGSNTGDQDLSYLEDASIIVNFNGGGSALTTGIKADLEIPFDCTITEAILLSDQTGSIVIDIWKDSYANFPPTDADSITASAPPTLSSASKSQDASLTDWSKSLVKGDILRFNIDSITTITRAILTLKVTKV